MYKFLLSLFVTLFMPFLNSAQAVTITDNMKQALKTVPDTPGMANIIASLLVVILMIYVVSWFYMKLTQINSKNIFKQHKKAELNKPKIISGITLGQNRHLYVVSLNNKYLVLGVTPNNISLIKEFDPQEADEAENFIKDKEQNKELISEEQQIVNDLFKDLQQSKKVLNNDIEDICNKYL